MAKSNQSSELCGEQLCCEQCCAQVADLVNDFDDFKCERACEADVSALECMDESNIREVEACLAGLSFVDPEELTIQFNDQVNNFEFCCLQTGDLLTEEDAREICLGLEEENMEDNGGNALNLLAFVVGALVVLVIVLGLYSLRINRNQNAAKKQETDDLATVSEAYSSTLPKRRSLLSGCSTYTGGRSANFVENKPTQASPKLSEDFSEVFSKQLEESAMPVF